MKYIAFGRMGVRLKHLLGATTVHTIEQKILSKKLVKIFRLISSEANGFTFF